MVRRSTLLLGEEEPGLRLRPPRPAGRPGRGRFLHRFLKGIHRVLVLAYCLTR